MTAEFQIDFSRVDTSYWRDHPKLVRSGGLWPGYHCNKDKELQRDFGITCGDYYRMYDAQEGSCRICGKEPQEKALEVDHDHYDKKIIYGLLCKACNRENTQDVKEHIKQPLGEQLGIRADPKKVDKRRVRQIGARKRAARAYAKSRPPQPPAPIDLSADEDEKYRRAVESSSATGIG